MMTDIRVRFNKTGRIKYISHLDMYRTFIRAIRRTDIPVWYTEGFNPHVYLNFVLPVPLGCESINDAFDMRITEDYPLEKIPAEMNKYLPEGLECTAATLLQDKAKNISSAKFELLYEKLPAKEILDILKNSKLTYTKIGKVNGRKAEKSVDISSNIFGYSIDTENNLQRLTIVMSAGNTININPFELATALSDTYGTEIQPILVKRTEMFTKNGKFSQKIEKKSKK